MKNILFVVPAFTVGGTNTSLISLLPFIDRDRYNVSVYALNPKGPMGIEIAKYGNVLNSLRDNGFDMKPSPNKNVGIRSFLSRLKKWMRYLGVDVASIYDRKRVRDLSKTKYDCVIAFQEGEATRFVQYFKDTRRVAWVRSDYARYLSVTNTPKEEKLYDKFDVIVNVSKTAMEGFLNVMPQCRDKSIYVYNLVNRERILSLSKQDVDFVKDPSVFTIVSLGRIDKVKHFNEIPEISLKLKEQGVKFRWIIIGGPTVRYPEEFETLKRTIANNNLKEQVIMLGHQPNPYPYLALSDLLVCLSESETFNHTFAEARTLGVPVLSVNYKGADEVLCKNQGGILSERESIADELKRMILDKSFYSILKKEAERYCYNNERQIENIYNNVLGG